MSAPKYCDDPDHCTYSDCPTAFCDRGAKHSFAAPSGSAFRVGALIVEKSSGQPGRITADLTQNLTYEPGSYECDLGHGYLVVRHRSEIEEMPNSY